MEKTSLLEKSYINYEKALCKINPDKLTIVKGYGNHDSKIVLIGEAPGGEEEKLGRPFVGSAGKNLISFLDSISLKQENLYFTNVVKFRPTSFNPKTGNRINRTPKSSEIKLSVPYLFEELKIINPMLIITLGNIPLKALSGNNTLKIGDVHGKILNINEYIVFPLYHPASIIYNQSLKETYSKDIEYLKSFLVEINYL